MSNLGFTYDALKNIVPWKSQYENLWSKLLRKK